MAELVFGPAEKELSITEINKHVEAILKDEKYFHTTDCAVHSPTLRPCSCGLETRLRSALDALRARVRELGGESLRGEFEARHNGCGVNCTSPGHTWKFEDWAVAWDQQEAEKAKP